MTSNDIAIKVESISKCYRIGLKDELHDSFAGALLGFIKSPLKNYRKYRSLYKFEEDSQDQGGGFGNNPSDIIWALKDISFDVKRGEVIGIIGRNGAGKSTLLKILSKITDPTKGQAEIRGRISSLLEVGTGFHPELTGRENIYLNGTILGMTKKEVDRKFDQIVDFSGIEKFIDTPVKRYSSGMKVRLAFSVAAHLEPEILLVDEVLAVGDAQFQKKCLGKMEHAAKEGRTVLFVSHNMGTVRQLCPMCLWLEDGRIQEIGPSNVAIDSYLESTTNESLAKNNVIFHEDLEKEFQLRAVRLLDDKDRISEDFNCDKPIIIELVCQVRRPLPGLYGYLKISRTDGTTVMVSDSFDTVPNPFDNLQVGIHRALITIPARTLGPGDYAIYLNFTSKFSTKDFHVDSPGWVCSFKLRDFTSHRGNRRIGFFSTQLSWALTTGPSKYLINRDVKVMPNSLRNR